ncbi:hypothetical protein ACQZV8_17970, partial [Magnetococcales bacterium HHB-1]
RFFNGNKEETFFKQWVNGKNTPQLQQLFHQRYRAPIVQGHYQLWQLPVRWSAEGIVVECTYQGLASWSKTSSVTHDPMNAFRYVLFHNVPGDIQQCRQDLQKQENAFHCL